MDAGNEPHDGLSHWAAYKPIYFGAIGVAAVLLLVWLGLTFFLYPKGDAPSDAIAARGQFGDMFGLANALFSGLAFTALIFSLHLQRRDLKRQQEEMKLALCEATKQAQALAEQASTMAQQAGNELLAARINGTGILLQAQIATLSNRELYQWMSIQGENVHEAIKKNHTELNMLLKTAAKAPTR